EAACVLEDLRISGTGRGIEEDLLRERTEAGAGTGRPVARGGWQEISSSDFFGKASRRSRKYRAMLQRRRHKIIRSRMILRRSSAPSVQNAHPNMPFLQPIWFRR